MAETVISLTRARKAKARAKAQVDAAANRVRFGRTGAQKRSDALAAGRAQEDLDGKKRES